MADQYLPSGASWTYGNDPENSNRDEVRFLSGDCVATEKWLSNTEIAYCIAKEPTNELAAANAAERIAAKVAREMSQGAEGFSGSLEQRMTHFINTAKALRKKYGQGVPEVGGIDKSDNEALDDETDIVLTKFELGMHDHPDTFEGSEAFYLEDE